MTATRSLTPTSERASRAMLSEITQVQLDQIRELIYKETGILYETKKDYAMKARIERRMEASGHRTFRRYYRSLLLEDPGGELQNLIEELTVNETYFFRDFPQLQGFGERALPLLLEEKKKVGDSTLKIWSAACSTGEEPYTLSIIAQEMIEDYERWDVSILATDIDRQVLRIAKKGEYGRRSMKDTPLVYRKKYFSNQGTSWQVLPHTAEPVHFDLVNLIDRRAMRKQRGFDFIFCRNVLIYFNELSRKKVVNSFYDALNPGGFLFLGASESVGRITAAFQLTKLGDQVFYRKPQAGSLHSKRD
ncbi:MAG: protein-glutamate O-methyltransferase CheR [Acidobacteriota bacterium]|nr:protein-glutamate O-methyltransferase CheR [Acidobacteriota bacterium]